MPAIDTIVSVIEKSYSVYMALKTIHEAPETIKSLQLEVVRVRGLLTRIVEIIGNDEDTRDKCEEALRLQPDLIEQARLLTEAANKFLEKTTRRKEDGMLEVKSSTWLLNVSEAKDLATKFSAFHGAVSAIYALNTSASITLAGPSIIRAMDERMTHAVRHEIAGVNETLRQTIREEWVRLFEERQEAMARTMVHTMMSVARDQQEGRSQLFDELSILRDNPQAVHGSLAGGLPSVMQGGETASTHSLIRRSSTSSLDLDRQSIMTSATCDSLDTVSPRPRPCPMNSRSGNPQPCPSDCSCRCHQPSSACQLMPLALNRSLGMHIPGALVSSLTSPTQLCDDTRCVQNRNRLIAMQQLFPTWFARVEGTIRTRSCPIHFKIQTPRVVQSLNFLCSISLDEFKMKLTNREITVNDAQRDGRTILHALSLRAAYEHGDRSVTYEMMHLAVDAGARYDWEFTGYTMTEYMLYLSQLACQADSMTSSILESFNYNIVRPLLGEDLGDGWDSMRVKRNWSDLHYLLANPPRSPVQRGHDLAAILGRPSAALDVNAKERFGWAPLRHAIWSCPDAIDALLRAGANPGLVVSSPLGYTAQVLSWGAVGPLVRAGANINERARWSNGRLATPLHDVILVRYARPGDRLRTALELVRHGGHLLDWDIQNEHGNTPLDCAEWRVQNDPNDEEAASLYKLCKTRKLPPGVQLIDRPRLGHENKTTNPGSMSLVQAGIEGKIDAVGALISAGAMVNERDEAGRTLLHLVAMGVVLSGYAVAVEVVRYGGYAVDWDAVTKRGKTAETLARKTLNRVPDEPGNRSIVSSVKSQIRSLLPSRYKVTRAEMAKILDLLQRRALPPGIDYIYPCMHPTYCRKCSSLPCTGGCPG